MEREQEVEMGGNSRRGAGVAGRHLYAVVTRLLTSAEAANAPESSWVEADPMGRDAPISVWWENPPFTDPQ